MQSANQTIIAGPVPPAQRAELEMLLRQLQQRPAPTSEQVALQERELMRRHKREDLAGVAGFFLVIPLVLAVASRIMRRGHQTPKAIPSLDNERFNRLEQAVDAIAVEIERIGEAQRFQTKLMSETANAVKVAPLLSTRTPV